MFQNYLIIQQTCVEMAKVLWYLMPLEHGTAEIKACAWHLFWEAGPDFQNTSVACAVGPSVTTSSTDFFFQNLVFCNLFEFLAAEIT
jgi:hypothetical protein